MTAPTDDHEYRSLADWCAQLGLDADEVGALLAANPGRDGRDAVTAEELADLFGPVRLAATPKDVRP